MSTQQQTFPAAMHPYYPLGVRIPDYVPNELSVPALMAALGGMLGSVLLGTSSVALRTNPHLTASGLACFCWFVLCGCLHCFFEGHFIFNHETLASSQNLFSQLWKEYSLSDSRYLTSDAFMLSVESITMFFWGPLSFACALSIVKNSHLRHPLQIIVCMAHLYGVALYYATSLLELHLSGTSHSRPEFQYFWLYYVGFNLPWVIVPLFLLIDSIMTISRVLRAFDQVADGIRSFQQELRLENESKKDR